MDIEPASPNSAVSAEYIINDEFDDSDIDMPMVEQDVITKIQNDLQIDADNDQLINKLIDGNITFSEFNAKLDTAKEISDELDNESNTIVYKLTENTDEATDTVMKKLFQQANKDNLSDKKVKNVSGGTSSDTTKKKRTILPAVLQGLMGQANLCYVRGQLNEAEKACLEIIRQSPFASEPYYTLAQIHEDNLDKFMQFSLIAAHLNPIDIDQWIRLAQIAVENENFTLAISCYSNAIRSHPKNLDLRLRRIELLKMINDEKLVNRAYAQLVYVIPPEEQPDYLLEISKKVAHYYHESKLFVKALEILSFAYSKIPNLFSMEDINFLLELFIVNKIYKCVLDILSTHTKVNCHTKSIDIPPGILIQSIIIPHDIDIEFRTKLVVSLIHLKSYHLLDELIDDVLKCMNAEDDGDCYVDIADALITEEKYEYALKLLVPLINSVKFSFAAVFLRYANCLRILERTDEAIDAYRQVIQLAPQHCDARLLLSSLLKQKGLELEALQALEQNFDFELIDPTILYERCNMLKNIGKLDTYIDISYLLLSRNCLILRNFEEIQAALTLTRLADRLTTIRKSRETRGESIEDDGPAFSKQPENQLTFDTEWSLFLDILKVSFKTKRFSMMQKILFTTFTYKRFHQSVPHRNYIEFLALLSTIFNRHPYFGFTIIRDRIVKNLNSLRYWNLFNAVLQFTEDFRYNKFLTRLMRKNPNNTNIIMLRANYLLLSGSYKYALYYYALLYRKLNDPILPLLLAITYAHIALQKQARNRHQLFQEALGFILQYSKHRESEALHEIHYNLGRFYQQMGMISTAVYHYKIVLLHTNELIEKYPELVGLRQEAAFNLHLIYKASGNDDLARECLFEHVIV